MVSNQDIKNLNLIKKLKSMKKCIQLLNHNSCAEATCPIIKMHLKVICAVQMNPFSSS